MIISAWGPGDGMDTFSVLLALCVSPVKSPHKGQWRGALILCLICAWINGWVNNGEADDLRCHRTHYDVIVMCYARMMRTCNTENDILWSTVSFTQIGWLSVRWRHNDHAGVSNHQPHGCLLNRLFRRKSKKTSKLCVTGLCAGNSPGTGEFPAQMASYAENVSIWWRHHGHVKSLILVRLCRLAWLARIQGFRLYGGVLHWHVIDDWPDSVWGLLRHWRHAISNHHADWLNITCMLS